MPNLSFSEAIMGWYLRHKRDLPWRHSKDPYIVWVSEIILQQTRVDQGLPYFSRITQTWPTISDMANASEEQVLKLWQGLGYYSRARNMHATAREVAFKHRGIFPQHYQEILQLKGIGPYTAAAIASFCFDITVPVVDGNVERVLSRYHGIDEGIDLLPTKKLIRQLAEDHIPAEQPAWFNQSIMEFGALQCVPVAPNCAQCPLADECQARSLNRVAEIPFKSKKTKVKPVFLHYLALTDGQNFVFRLRSNDGVWKHLHDFLLFESDRPWSDIDLENQVAQYGQLIARSGPIKHLLSHRKMDITFSWVKVAKLKNFKAPQWKRLKLYQWMEYPVPKPIHDFLNQTDWELIRDNTKR
jgi:A/G-specific adenine glycosylase